MAESTKPQIFLCHASEDQAQVFDIYRRLKERGFHPWLDKKDLLTSQNWLLEIPKALKASDFVLIFFSKASVAKAVYVQKEFVLDEMPEGKIFIIPVRLDECQVPEKFQDLHWTNLFEEDGFESIVKSIQAELGHREPSLASLHRDILVDSRTGLMWTRNDNGKNIDWHGAVEYAKNLRLGGYSDWRLPSIDDLEGIYDENNTSSTFRYKGTDCLIHTINGFQLSTRFIWSGTKEGSDRAWSFGFTLGKRYHACLGDFGDVRALCVRSSGE